MGKRSVGLQKGLSTILNGVQLPEEARRNGLTGPEMRESTGCAHLDPIALFEDIVRRKRLMHLSDRR